VLRSVSVGRERTLYQDPAYGLRQLVDIAAQSLSPALNAPTTATQVIDRLTDLLPRIAAAPDPTGLFADAEGRLRVAVPVIRWPQMVQLAFTEIRVFGARSPQVVRRTLAALETLLDRVPPERRPPLERERRLLLAAARATAASEAERDEAVNPDDLGLG
jgi:uncharacterized membrane protein